MGADAPVRAALIRSAFPTALPRCERSSTGNAMICGLSGVQFESLSTSAGGDRACSPNGAQLQDLGSHRGLASSKRCATAL